MDSEDVLRNGGISIAVGDGTSRREVLKQVGAAGAVLGLAGCLSDGRRDTPAPTEEPETDDPTPTDPPSTASHTSTAPPEPARPPDPGVRTAPRHPAVAPPTWDPAKTESGDELAERRAVFALQNIDNPFFTPIVCGFHDALHQFGWTGAVRGPPVDGDHSDQTAMISDQIAMIEEEIERMEPGDVIVTTVLNATSYRDAIQQALDNDIVVVNAHTTPAARNWNYDIMREEFISRSPVTGEDREMIVPHVGINNARAGAAMAAEMHDRLRARFPDQDEYTVFVVNDLPDIPPISRRVDKRAADEGTAQRYFEAQDDVSIYGNQVFDTPQPPQISTSRNFVVDTIQDEGIDAVVASAFWAAAGAGAAHKEGELSENMLVCGFDLAGDLSVLRDGLLDFIVSQDLYSQGYQSASMAHTYVERGIAMKDLEWGVSIWDERNVEFGTERRSWTELLDWQRDSYDGVQ
jgi:ABC-type sugar transport system substrate-binding protein